MVKIIGGVGSTALDTPAQPAERSMLSKVGGAIWKPIGATLDALSVGNYAVGGILSGKGAARGIKERTSASEGLGINNFWLGLATDILLDPLTYVGGLGLASKVPKAAQAARSAKIAQQTFRTQLRQNLDTALNIPREIRQARVSGQQRLAGTLTDLRADRASTLSATRMALSDTEKAIGSQLRSSIGDVASRRRGAISQAQDESRSTLINIRNEIDGPLTREELAKMTINEQQSMSKAIDKMISAEKTKLNEDFATRLQQISDPGESKKLQAAHYKDVAKLEKDFRSFRRSIIKEASEAMTIKYKQNATIAKSTQRELQQELSAQIASIKTSAKAEIDALRLAASTARGEAKEVYMREIAQVRKNSMEQIRTAQSQARQEYNAIKENLLAKQQAAFKDTVSTIQNSAGLVQSSLTDSAYAATFAERGRRGQTSLVQIAVPGLGRYNVPGTQPILDAMTKAGEAWRSTKVGRFTRKVFNQPTATAAEFGLDKSLESIEQLRSIERQIKRATLLAEGQKSSANRTAQAVLKGLDNKIAGLKAAGKITDEDLAKVTQNISDELSGVGAKFEVPKELKEFYDFTLDLAKKEYAERAKVIPEFADKAKGLTLITNKAWREAQREGLSEAGQIAGVAKRFQEDPSTLFSKHFKLGDDFVISNNKRNKAESIVTGEKYIRVGDKWINGNTPANANIKEAINRLNEAVDQAQTIAPIRHYDDMVQEGLLGNLKLSEREQARFNEILASPSMTRDLTASPVEWNRVYKDSTGFTPFEESPQKILAQIIENTGISKANAVMQSELASLALPPSIPKNLLPNGGRGFKTLSNPGIEGYVMPADIADYVSRVYTAATSVEEVGTFIKIFDGVNNAVKSLLTVVNPAFLFRNILGNGFQLYSAGINPIHAGSAAQVVSALVGKNARELQGAGGRVTLANVLEAGAKLKGKHKKQFTEFLENGGLGTNFFREVDDTGAFGILGDLAREGVEELGQTGRTGLAQAANTARGLVSDAARSMTRTAELGDVWARYALFLDRKAKGFNTADALADVRRYFFDYGDLSATEKAIFKRMAPFYTWSRNNIPLQVALLFEKPGKISQLESVRRNFEKLMGADGTERDDGKLPKWLADAFPVYIGSGDDEVKKFVRLQNIAPMLDLRQISSAEETMGFALDSINPLIKLPMELGSNYDFFFRRPIQQFEGEMVDGPFGTQMSPYSKKFLDLIRPIKEWDSLLNDEGSLADRLLRFGLGVGVTSVDPDIQESMLGADVRRESGLIRSSMRKIERKIEQGIATARDERELARLQELLDTLPERRNIFND